MKAIIYAAGRGTRLQSDSPKILLEFGGKTLLEWHALRLREAGVREIVLVTGHLREQVAEVLPDICARHDVALREIVNPRFHEGSLLSLKVSLPEIEESSEPLLLMDADVFYPTGMLDRLTESVHGTALLLDREFSTNDDDPMLVPVKNGRPIDFRKHWRGEADFVGESIGFFKIAPTDFPLLIKETEARSRGSSCADSYDDVLRTLVLAGRFGYEDVTGLRWIEIDFPADVIRARHQLVPMIVRSA
ncbi:MAG TPA: phosphocholine cytidylyltransferase family protein [Candidatus Udaeobacter sp.]|nr:MAG: ADP-glucose pyrophosphorylase [Verrucomicrobiota bacterium]PYL35856.1 MAG: ADP-glucose pyrophosphorylase [Verrucomicrobiota bacterium]HMC24710.1 phosphocholine cytidylyltransferase family protein [Candidatus Udaeobacter sp.]